MSKGFEQMPGGGSAPRSQTPEEAGTIIVDEAVEINKLADVQLQHEAQEARETQARVTNAFDQAEAAQRAREATQPKPEKKVAEAGQEGREGGAAEAVPTKSDAQYERGQKALENFATAVSSEYTRFREWMGRGVSGLWSGLGKRLSGAVETAKKRAVTAVGASLDAKDTVAMGARLAVEDVRATTSRVGKAADRVGSDIETLGEVAGAVVDVAGETIVEGANRAGERIEKFGKDAESKIRVGLKSMGDALDTFGKDTEEGGMEVIQWISDTATKAYSESQRVGRDFLQNKYVRATGKVAKYLGFGTVATAVSPVALIGTAFAGPIMHRMNPEMYNATRERIRAQGRASQYGAAEVWSLTEIPKMVVEDMRKVGRAAYDGVGSWAERQWKKATGLKDRFLEWGNEKRLSMMESMGIASTDQVKKAMKENEELKAKLAELTKKTYYGNLGPRR